MYRQFSMKFRYMQVTDVAIKVKKKIFFLVKLLLQENEKPHFFFLTKEKRISCINDPKNGKIPRTFVFHKTNIL